MWGINTEQKIQSEKGGSRVKNKTRRVEKHEMTWTDTDIDAVASFN